MYAISIVVINALSHVKKIFIDPGFENVANGTFKENHT
jgi:hypothetical protein